MWANILFILLFINVIHCQDFEADMEISWNASSHLIAMYKPETSWPSFFSIISLVEDSNMLFCMKDNMQAIYLK